MHWSSKSHPAMEVRTELTGSSWLLSPAGFPYKFQACVSKFHFISELFPPRCAQVRGQGRPCQHILSPRKWNSFSGTHSRLDFIQNSSLLNQCLQHDLPGCCGGCKNIILKTGIKGAQQKSSLKRHLELTHTLIETEENLSLSLKSQNLQNQPRRK